MIDEGTESGLRFSVLGSSSSGNSTFVTDGRNSVLIDAGLPVRYTVGQLEKLNGHADIDAIFVSHEHSDHVRNLFPLARRFGCPVYVSEPVSFALGRERHGTILNLKDRNTVRIGDMDIMPFVVPHDALEPYGFVVRSGSSSLGIVTDLGGADPDILDTLNNLTGLVIESNYDRDMLLKGPYPYPLKRRIAEGNGHLSNSQCRQLLERVIGPKTREVVLAHLSEENNDPLIAVRESSPVVRKGSPSCRLHLSYPRVATPLLRL
ncbi:MAG: MBL fold metallo-hydrolase [Thermoplasmatota archaeon]